MYASGRPETLNAIIGILKEILFSSLSSYNTLLAYFRIIKNIDTTCHAKTFHTKNRQRFIFDA